MRSFAFELLACIRLGQKVKDFGFSSSCMDQRFNTGFGHGASGFGVQGLGLRSAAEVLHQIFQRAGHLHASLELEHVRTSSTRRHAHRDPDRRTYICCVQGFLP